jgi:hypothetical protein
MKIKVRVKLDRLHTILEYWSSKEVEAALLQLGWSRAKAKQFASEHRRAKRL